MLSKSNLALLEAVKLGYKFDSSNNIVSPTGKIRKVGKSKGTRGYPLFNIKYNNEVYPIRIHKLKAYYLYGDKMFASGIEVRHLDGNSMNCSDSNIVLGTSSQNHMDTLPEKRIAHAKKAALHTRKFTDGEAAEIRKINKFGIGYGRIAKMYRVCKSTIAYIVQNKMYKQGAIAQLGEQ